MAFALCSVSIHSFCATESVTIPAPAWMKPFDPFMNMLLIPIAKSQQPNLEQNATQQGNDCIRLQGDTTRRELECKENI